MSDELLASPEVVHRSVQPGRPGRSEPLPDALHPALAEALERRGVTGLYAHQAETWEAVARGEHVVVTTGTASGKSLAFSLPGARRDRARADDAGALPLSDEGAGAGPGALARVPRPARSPAGDLRRRHADRAARAHPPERERDPHEPGHAPRRRPPAPRPLGRRAPQPAGRRGRRGPRVPRRLRVARRERASPAAPTRARLRRRAGVRPRVGDDREPRRARRAPDRARRPGGRRRHVAAGRQGDRALEPRAARRGARHACQRALGRIPAPGRPRRRGTEDDLLHEEPEGGGARPPLRERPSRQRDRPPARAVPGGVHARAAAGDRAAARRGRAARGDRDGRAGARHRHRLARLRDLRGLPGHRCVAPPAVGPRRSSGDGARRARRERGRARPVLHERAPGAARADDGGGADRPRRAADPRRPRARGGVRGPADGGRRGDPRARGARAGGAPARARGDGCGVRLARPRHTRRASSRSARATPRDS